MQPVVVSLQLTLLLAVQVHGGVFGPSLLVDTPAEDSNLHFIFHVGEHAKTNNAQSSSCADDPTWVDVDGDGCAAYAAAIEEGALSKDVACGFKEPGVEDPMESGDPEGAGLHCRATCGTCPAEHQKEAVRPTLERPCVDNPNWVDEDGDGCDVYAKHIETGQITQAMACGFHAVEGLFESGNPEQAAFHCRATCGTCATASQMAETSQNDQNILSSFSKHLDELSSEPKERQCMDDPSWVDMDGDGCAVYAKAIARGEIRQEQACGRSEAYLLSGNPSEAAKYCPVTCGNCPLEVFEDNDSDMKDLIRYLVNVESDLILQSSSVEEVEKEETPEVTTTTTTESKKLPGAEVPTNATWAVYECEEEEEKMEFSDMEKFKISDIPQQSGFKPSAKYQHRVQVL